MTTQKTHRVSVAMSVYNPRAEYFREQVDSILEQTSEPVLVMRNDGSPNLETVALCAEYADRDNVVVIDGVNLGFAAGFLAALRACPDTDYYAFSDQDDFWLPEKLSRAVEELDEVGAFIDSVPVMYHSDFVFCDQNLNEVADTPNRRLSSSLENAVAEAAIPGMVMVFNRAMRERLLSVDPDGIAGHDWLCALISNGYGKTISDPRVSLKYRRHSENVSAGNMGAFQRLSFRIRTFLFGETLGKVRVMIKRVATACSGEFSAHNRELIDLYSRPITVLTQLRKAFWPVRYRETVGDELAFRLLVLLGRM